jgi:NTP pyrophosphatase (non-canonical NTP hydrolase)
MSLKHDINAAVDICHEAAYNAGWWHDAEGMDIRTNPMCFSQKLMLAVSELAESMEGDRKDLMDDKLPHREMREAELADCVIRCFDTAGAFNFDLGGAIEEKLRYNKTRLDHQKDTREATNGKKY